MSNFRNKKLPSIFPNCYYCSVLTSAEYVLIGGQLLAPQTRAKWMSGSCSVRATLRRGSDEPNGFENIPTNNQPSIFHVTKSSYRVNFNFPYGDAYIKITIKQNFSIRKTLICFPEVNLLKS